MSALAMARHPAKPKKYAPVIIRPVKCPACGSRAVLVQRTKGMVRYSKCGSCGASFKVIRLF